MDRSPGQRRHNIKELFVGTVGEDVDSLSHSRDCHTIENFGYLTKVAVVSAAILNEITPAAFVAGSLAFRC
eukprot:1856142-Karenia_brevis.AAC.1